MRWTQVRMKNLTLESMPSSWILVNTLPCKLECIERINTELKMIIELYWAVTCNWVFEMAVLASLKAGLKSVCSSCGEDFPWRIPTFVLYSSVLASSLNVEDGYDLSRMSVAMLFNRRPNDRTVLARTLASLRHLWKAWFRVTSTNDHVIFLYSEKRRRCTWYF